MSELRGIVLVDDSATTNFLNGLLIEKSGHGYPVKTFENPRDALHYFEGDIPLTQLLIFVDINMPQMTGWELVDHLITRKIHKSHVIVMLTSSIDLRDEERAKKNFAIREYLTKPLTIPMLDQLVKTYFLSEPDSKS